MEKQTSQKRNNKRLFITFIFLALWCLYLIYSAYKSADATVAIALAFAFSALAVYAKWMYSNIKKLKASQQQPDLKDRNKLLISAIGGYKTMIIVVFVITFGTLGIIVLGGIATHHM